MLEINDIKEIPECSFPINLKLIQKYQRIEPSLMDTYKDGTYHNCSFRRGSNDNFSLITCNDKIVILSILQSYVLHWYHTYILHPVMDRTEANIFQHLYRPNIKYSLWKEVTNYDTFRHTKRSNKKYGKLPAKEVEEILWNKLCVDIIGPYVIRRKVPR